MKIKTKLQLIIIVNIIILAGIISLSLLWQKQAERLSERESLISELNLSIFERARFREEYFMYGSDRSKEQFLLIHEKIGKHIESMAGIFDDPEERPYLNNIAGAHKKIGALFNRLVRLDEIATVHTASTQASRERIISQMLVNARSMYQDGLNLLKEVNEKTAYPNNLVHQFSNIAFGLLALFICSFAVIIIRNITYPLTRLHEGTEIIAEGNLDYKTNIRTPDEIGQLSNAFDSMTENLQKITVSRDELGKEIDKRKQTEEALRWEKDFAESIIQTAQAIVLVIDTSGHIVSFNPYMEDILGYTLEEVQGKDWFSIFLPERYQNSIRELFLKAIDDIQTKGNVNSIVTKDGRELMIEWYDKTLKDEKGNIVGLLAIGQDITSRKHAEEVLRLSEENFRRSLDDSPLGMRIATIEGETLYANRAILDFYGYDSIDELRTTPIKERYTPESFAEFQVRKEKRKRGDNAPSKYEIRIIGKDGEIRHLHVFRKEVLWDGERQFQVIYQDITDRKRAEEALEKSERKLTDIIEFLPDATFVIDLEGKVIAWNRAIEELTGISKEDMIGQGDYAYTVPFYGVRRRQLLDLIDISDRDLESKYEYVQRKGNTLYAEAFTPALYGGKGAYVFATATPLFDAQGIRVGAIESIRNITERKKAEEALKNTYEQVRSLASRLQEVREETRTNIAHDIHDELGGALAGLKMDLLRLESVALGEEDREKRQAMLDIIHGAKELINNTILSTRRIIMEQRPSVLDDFGLVPAMEWQLGEFKTHSDISSKFNVGQIEIDIDKNLATVVFRIFQEALANVIQHSKATEVYISLRVDEGQLILEIKDNGRGITEDELTGTVSIGILGMRERALAHGGEINIAGESGKGTTLNLKIPIQ